MTGNEARNARVEHANALLASISSHGRRFFRDERSGRVSRFRRYYGTLYLIDKYTEMPIAMRKRASWRHFSDGGTMRALIEAMAVYIKTGKPMPARYFGPWAKEYCDGDLWGYGAEAWAALRAEVAVSPVVAPAARADA